MFAPGINFINSPSDKDYFDDPTPIIRTYGFEMPFISTIRMDKRLRFSRILRYGYDRVQIEDISNYSDITSTDLHRFALIGGLSFHPHKTAASLQLNLGIELLTPLTGKYGLMPILGFGLKL